MMGVVDKCVEKEYEA